MWVLTVTIDAGDERSASANVQVTCRTIGSPEVVISTSDTDVRNVDPNSRLALAASVELPAESTDGVASWTVSPKPSGGLVANVQTALSLPGGAIASTYPYTLILPSAALSPGTTYTFTLSCSTATGTSNGVVTVITNAPPDFGTVTVSPVLGGVELTTSYIYTTELWEDEAGDYPLTYVFGHFFETDVGDDSSSRGYP